MTEKRRILIEVTVDAKTSITGEVMAAVCKGIHDAGPRCEARVVMLESKLIVEGTIPARA